MDLPYPLILVMTLIIAGIGLALRSNHKLETRRRAEYQAFADRHGLALTHVPSSGRKPAELRFDGAGGLSLVLTRPLTRKRGNTTTRTGGTTQLRFADPRLEGGLAIYTPEVTQGLAQAASVMMGMFDNGIARKLLGKLLGDEIGAHLGELREQPVPEGLRLTIMATIDPNPMFDAAAIEQALNAAPAIRNAESKTMVMINGAGLQIRVGRSLDETTDLKTLLDAGLALQAALRRPDQRASI